MTANTAQKSSNITSFYKLSFEQRLSAVRDFSGLSDEEILTLKSGSLPISSAQRMIENVIGVLPLPLGIAVNFLINGRDYLVPMAIEEPSVVAAASHAAKIARQAGGFKTSSTEPVMIGQIQLIRCPDPSQAERRILESKREILDKANKQDSTLVSLGGGAKDLRVRVFPSLTGTMVVTELLVDCRDAMGANVVNTMAESVAPLLESLSKGKANLRIISNLADKRVATATARFPKEPLGGEQIVDGIVDAYAFAAADLYRCATHNKGVMNGITAVCLATGNDTRAIEAGAHSYASRSGHYSPLTKWGKTKEGDLEGAIEVPVAVGIVGGITSVHPLAKICLKILGVRTARELGEVIAAVGLAQNLAALRALAAEGIQQGHMSLHARNIAATAGATSEMIDIVSGRMIEEKRVRIDRAKQLVEELSSVKKPAGKEAHKSQQHP